MLIKPQEMFATPNSWKDIENWIEKHPKEDRAHLYTAAMMTWNLLAKQVNPYNDVLEDFADVAKDVINDPSDNNVAKLEAVLVRYYNL